ncbi:MAG: DNA internalization-related competence protein ComEC/Rec2, partial [Myxococcales bacterium]|nr:DNA internalization-related competence protein ComEC/Rec2 [Myxococcales bacterium]
STAIALSVCALALGLPLLDTFTSVFRRWRRGRSLFDADREHIHHRLLALGLSTRQVALLLYAFCGALGVFAVLVKVSDDNDLRVGLLVLALVAVFRRVPAIALGPGAHRTAALVALPVVALYTALVGAAPSAVRAALMVAALLVGHAFARLREAWSALALAVIVMVAWDPATLGDPGFQLSFASVAALLRIQPALADWLAPRRRSWRAWRRAPVEALLASVAATVGTTPLVLRHFGVLPVAGLIANLPAAPWASLVVVPLSLFGGLLAGVSPELAAPVLKLAGHAAGVLQAMAEHASALPGAAVRLPQPTILECVLFYGATIGFSLPVNRGRGPRRLAWLSVAGLALSLTVGLGARFLSKEVQVTFLPVGQGDGAVVELPGGRAILVDTGPGGSGMDAAERVLLPFLRARRIDSLDAVVLTHAHADHTGSLATLAEQIPIKEVWWTGDAREGPEWLPGLVAELGAREVAAGSEPYVAGPATVRFLGPVKDPRSYGDINDGSVVISVELGARRILMVGDAEAVAEQDLLQACAECLDADVLKAGHHGSRSSTTDAFLTAVSPEHAVLSCGLHNHFGFPHPEVVARLEAAGVRVWRTDLEGAIIVRTDGEALEVYSYEARRQRAISPRADPPPAVPSTRPAP